ncbi:MAG: ATP-binding cassette domain-containing protein, partial [Proteobacteria bacterium]|nr:ATP-binding cassette domain-containing protein [Pseudomonadota bacterium]
MLEASNLECVRGDRRLFAGVGFRLDGGEMLYLQGRNGTGKTSLLRMLCGLTPPAAGEIRWRGE